MSVCVCVCVCRAGGAVPLSLCNSGRREAAGKELFTSKSVSKMFSNGVQNPKHLRFQRQS